jgi:hypothetical protein
MKPELPKSIGSALAQKGSVTTHPSADMLTAFAEHMLTAAEKERVADHLARCQECRDVLYLASNVDEQYAVQTERAAKLDLKPRSRWMPKLAWAASGIAGIAIVGGVLVQQHLARDGSNQKVTQAAQMATQPAPIVAKPETSNPPALPAEVAKATHAPKAKSSEDDKLSYQAEMAATKPPSPNAPNSSGAAAVPQAKPVNQPPGAVIGGPANSFTVAVPTQNGFAERPNEALAQGFTAGQLSDMSRAFVHQAPATTWRITPEGHLEHLSPTGWTGVLTDQTTKFRVVSESPNGVWAGGSQAELFHSEDGGANWNQVALPVPPDGKSDAIVAIHFVDLQHGMVLTDGGTRYTTSDGGKNWQRE